MTNVCPTTPYSAKKGYSEMTGKYSKKTNPFTAKENYTTNMDKYSAKHYCPVGFLQQGNYGYLNLESGGRIIIS